MPPIEKDGESNQDTGVAPEEDVSREDEPVIQQTDREEGQKSQTFFMTQVMIAANDKLSVHDCTPYAV